MYLLVFKDFDGIDYKQYRLKETAQDKLKYMFISWNPEELDPEALEAAIEYGYDPDNEVYLESRKRDIENMDLQQIWPKVHEIADAELSKEHAMLQERSGFLHEARIFSTDELIEKAGPDGKAVFLLNQDEDEMSIRLCKGKDEAEAYLYSHQAQDGDYLMIDLADYKTDIVYYFDMDGVLAVFDKFSSQEDTFMPGYFYHRQPEKAAIDTVKMLYKAGKDVRILSSVYQNGHAAQEKRYWLRTNGLSDVPYIFVPYGEKKEDYIEKASLSVLVDDFSRNLHSWKQAGADHLGIKFLNGINGTKGTWKSYVVSNRMTAEEIYREVVGVAEMTAQAAS